MKKRPYGRFLFDVIRVLGKVSFIRPRMRRSLSVVF